MYNHKPTFWEWMLYGVFAPINNKTVRNVLTGAAVAITLYSTVKDLKEL